MTDILNLPKWDVIELEEAHDEYIIRARYTVQPEVCLSCGVIHPKLHRYGTKQQPFRDLPMHGKKVQLLVQRKKWKCLECGSTFFEQLSDIDDHHRSTKRLINWVQTKALERTFTSLADEIGVDEGTIRNIFNRHISHLEETVIFNTPRWLGIDELHLLGNARGILTNVEKRTIIDILPGRKKPEIAKRLMALKDREKIELVAMDMWIPYRDAVRAVLPQAVIVIDKFHIVRMANQAIDKVRKRIREGLTDRQRRTLMHDRFLLFRRRSELPPNKAILLATWLETFPELAVAYELKEAIYDLWDTETDKQTAIGRYRNWVTEVRANDLVWAFGELITALANWEAEAFAYFDHPVTNAVTEALNGVAKVVNRIGRGYSFRAIRAKMLYSTRNLTPKAQVTKERPVPYKPDEKPEKDDMVFHTSDGVYIVQLKQTIIEDATEREKSIRRAKEMGAIIIDCSTLYSE